MSNAFAYPEICFNLLAVEEMNFPGIMIRLGVFIAGICFVTYYISYIWREYFNLSATLLLHRILVKVNK